jgi:hypothetical protein
LRVLDYWAQAGQIVLVGVSLQLDNHTVEYWLPMSIDPIAGEPLDTYLTNLQIQWRTKIREMSPWAAQCFAHEAIRFALRMRYQGNTLRVGFTPEEVAAAGIDKPLAELPLAKDRCVTHDAEVLTYPAMPEELAENSGQLLFSGVSQAARIPNPEVPGGHIALIATNNNPVQEPPFALDRMHASRQKQIAFNRRVLKTEDQVAGINPGLGDFLQDMSFNDEDPVFICVGIGHTMRGTQPVGGQLWTQGSRQMTANNKALEGMDSSRESVALSGIAEAVAWRHALENTSGPNYLRRCQRIVVYPKFLTKCATVMTTGNVGLDLDGGHDIASERIMAECQTRSENCRQLGSGKVASTCGKGIGLGR